MSTDKSALESFSHLWNEQRDTFVLLKVRGSDLNSTDGCLIYNVKEYSTLLIEDDDLAQAIMAKMKAAGVPVVLRGDLPSGQNEAERMINEMLESGKTGKEINEAINAYKSRGREGYAP